MGRLPNSLHCFEHVGAQYVCDQSLLPRPLTRARTRRLVLDGGVKAASIISCTHIPNGYGGSSGRSI